MSLTKQTFTKNWTDSDDFPTFVENESQVRADLQELHTQTQTYINSVLTEELDAALAGKVPKAGLNMTAVNNGDGTLTVALKLGTLTLASAVLNVGEAENITNTFITNELYVNYGWIADLMVNRLRTDSERAGRYLNSNTSPLNYLDIHGELIRFISAVPSASSAQLSYDGQLYWWADGEHTRLTTEETAYPAMSYVYSELTKLAFEFREVALSGGGTAVIPVLIFGAGNGSGDSGRAFIYKDTAGLRIKYLTESGGVPVSLELDNSGDLKKNINGVSGTVQAALTFVNMTVQPEDWEADETWEDYPFRAVLSTPGVTAGMCGEVIFHPSAVKANSLSGVAVTGAGTVTVFAAEAPAEEVDILQIRAVF